MRVALIENGREAKSTSVLVRETKAGDLYIQEASVRRAAKRLGCDVKSLRLHPQTGYAVGTAKFNVISSGLGKYPLFGIITSRDFTLREEMGVA